MTYVKINEYKLCNLTTKELISLGEIDLLFIRQNPAYDMKYITSTYILEKCQNLQMINDPTSI